MDAIFLKLLNMSISATWVVLIVLLLRLLLKKAPKWIHCTLWALVAVRLICPFSFESVLSLLPSGEVLPSEVINDGDIKIHTGFEAVDTRINSGVLEAYMEGVTVPVGNTSRVMTALAVIWLLGMLLIAVYALITYVRLKKRVAPSVEAGEGIFLCDYIDSPFILGIVHPKIYLPSSMEPKTAECVLEHERAHLARRDHWWEPLGYLLLMLHWFNPILWLAYILLCRDIEMACDEKVIRDMDAMKKRQYSEALLACSMPRRLIAACPLAFGEVGVKERVKGILHYKKPAFWLVLVAVAACIVVAFCFLTDPAGMTLAKQFGISGLDSAIVTAGDQSHVFLEKKDVNIVKDFLKSARIESLPISQNRSEDRPKNYSITWSDGTSQCSLYFDADFTDVWMNDSVKPSLSYRLEDSNQARKFFEAMLDIEIPDAPSGGPDENGNYYFHGTVLRVAEKSVLVEPLEGCWELRSSDRIWVSLNAASGETAPFLQPGDTIRIVYDGMIAETYPAQIHNVYAIYRTDNVVTDAMLAQITADLKTDAVALFDYQIVGDTAVMGCQYGGDYGIIYLDHAGQVTVIDQRTLAEQAGAGGILMDDSLGVCAYLVTNPDIWCLSVTGADDVEYHSIMNFPALVLLDADPSSVAVLEAEN